MSSFASRSIVAVALLSSLSACEWSVHRSRDEPTSSFTSGVCGRGGETYTTSDEPASCDVTIDRYKELIVINRSVLLDRRARNDIDDAPWSFRSLIEGLAGDRNAASALAYAWLDQWRTVTSVGPERAPVTPRPAVTKVLLDPWMTSSGGSLATLPFRLIAIVNRPDLRGQEDGCSGAAGEIRFVYSAADPASPKRDALPMTVIVEVPYPATRSAAGWIEVWHALGSKPFGAEYNESLSALTAEVTKGSPPETWRVRTNEIALGEASDLPWELREFALAADAYGERRLVQIPIATTPRLELDRSASLDAWAEENEARILDGSYVLPGGFQAGAAPMSTSFFRWSSQRMDPKVREGLSKGTCNGCHGGERSGETSLPFQHIAASDQRVEYYSSLDDGETRLSRWLDNPSSHDDELARRERSMAQALCSTCVVDVPRDDDGAYQR